MAPHRARLPTVVRKKVQRWCRNFVFFALLFTTVWECYKNFSIFHGDAMKAYGFNGGRLSY